MSIEELSIRIEFDRPGFKAAFKAEESQTLRFTLTNNSDTTLNVLKWHTPLAGADSDMFRVEKAGKQAIYMGRIVHWAFPKPEDYLTLEPKASKSVEFDLTEAYDIHEPGDYSVEYKSYILDVGKEEPEGLSKRAAKRREFNPVSVRSNTVEFRLQNSRKPRQLKGVEFDRIAQLQEIAAKVPTFRNCSSDRQNILSNALAEAAKIASESKGILLNTVQSDRPNALRCTTWFGAYDSHRYDVVKSNFGMIWDALVNKDIIFNCTCDIPNAYAYVYPSKPYEIFLCNAFWNAPLNGTDSQAGTIVHETSHFYVVASTNDHVYGQSGCQSLAKTDPGKAIANADSHEYFAENNPYLEMMVSLKGLQIVGAPLSDRRVQLWAIAENGSVFSRWKSTTSSSAAWTSWSGFALPPGSTRLISIAVAPLSDRRLQLWAINANGAIWSCWKSTTDSSATWTTWTSFTLPPGIPSVKQLVAAPLSDGRLQLWAIAENGSVWSCWKSTTDSSATWTPWTSFTLPPGVPSVKQLAVAPLSDRRLQLWAIAENGSVWSCWKTTTSSGATWTPWSAFALPPGVTAIKYIMAVPLSDGRLQLFGIDNNNVIWSCWKSTTDSSATWTTWTRFI
jgi:peptidyl-Lys metalloendopeptidase